ncbi:MAG: YqeG family HAD IIIA-type phosphatase [Clostridiales bacterium]|nr:YqeG family HAD IIIA-type phosphatase [Clostridiales bacterium]
MFKKLKPNQMVESVCDIKLDELMKRGISNIIIDLDNTLIPWGEEYIIPEVYQWIKAGQEMGFKFCIVSNGSFKRIRHFASKFGMLAASKRGKPLSRAFKNAMMTLEGNKHNTAVIGDQIFTDILGGNMLDLYTILVEPISKKEFIGTRIMRFFEKTIAKRRRP